jgi:hypothetical protein
LTAAGHPMQVIRLGALWSPTKKGWVISDRMITVTISTMLVEISRIMLSTVRQVFSREALGSWVWPGPPHPVPSAAHLAGSGQPVIPMTVASRMAGDRNGINGNQPMICVSIEWSSRSGRR